ncbi:MAG TPA: hypothetical protein VIJ20_05500 [Solirubrobacteraceae bacterium]
MAQASESGHPQVVGLGGPAGVGKTSAGRRLAATARDRSGRSWPRPVAGSRRGGQRSWAGERNA